MGQTGLVSFALNWPPLSWSYKSSNSIWRVFQNSPMPLRLTLWTKSLHAKVQTIGLIVTLQPLIFLLNYFYINVFTCLLWANHAIFYCDLRFSSCICIQISILFKNQELVKLAPSTSNIFCPVMNIPIRLKNRVVHKSGFLSEETSKYQIICCV